MIFLSFFVWKNEKDMKMRVQDDGISKKEFDFWKERVEKPLRTGRTEKSEWKIDIQSDVFLVCVWVGVREKMLMGFYQYWVSM